MERARSDSAGAPRRWQRRKQARPAEILDAALDLFVARGFAATRLEDVAQRAGVTKGAMYLYFESKEALFKTVVRAAVVPALERVEHLIAEYPGSSRELLVRLLREWWQMMESTRLSGLPKLILSEAANFPELARFYHEEVIGRGHRALVAVLKRGVDRGEFRPLDLDYAARVLRAPVLMGLIWKHSLMKSEPQAMDLERYLDATLDLLMHGVFTAHPEEMPYV